MYGRGKEVPPNAMEVDPRSVSPLFDLTRDERLWGALQDFLTRRREKAVTDMETATTEAEWREAKGKAQLLRMLLQLPEVAESWKRQRQGDNQT